MKAVKERSGRWLSLGEAASQLGVDEATLRHWADTGKIRTFRTPGGHRRFQQDDLRALIQRETPRVDDLANLVERRSAKLLAKSPARPLRERPWYGRLDETMRARAREYGRDLFESVVRFVAEPSGRRSVHEHLLARSTQYGVELRQAGVRPADAAEAFAFFREMVLKLVTEPRGRGGMLDEGQVRTLLDVSALLDEIFATILHAWDRSETGPIATSAGQPGVAR
ncbi:MAG: helix-turn-helix domain-containing protein [Armatimonadota bacterium]|nr:helix-turn-helix domain-containing protein [Armatimonadota bacterium]